MEDMSIHLVALMVAVGMVLATVAAALGRALFNVLRDALERAWGRIPEHRQWLWARVGLFTAGMVWFLAFCYVVAWVLRPMV